MREAKSPRLLTKICSSKCVRRPGSGPSWRAASSAPSRRRPHSHRTKQVKTKGSRVLVWQESRSVSGSVRVTCRASLVPRGGRRHQRRLRVGKRRRESLTCCAPTLTLPTCATRGAAPFPAQKHSVAPKNARLLSANKSHRRSLEPNWPWRLGARAPRGRGPMAGISRGGARAKQRVNRHFLLLALAEAAARHMHATWGGGRRSSLSMLVTHFSDGWMHLRDVFVVGGGQG